MYEDQTFEEIKNRMLARVAAKFDKREGSIIHDAIAPAAVEFQNNYISLDAVLNEMFADTATRDYLIKHCADRGLTPKPASAAIVRGIFTPDTVDVPIGSRFSIFNGDFNYEVIERVDYGVYNLRCEQVGEEPNGATGQIIPIGYIQGLETAEITEILIRGEDEEDTEVLRARYMASINSESFGGNKIDYETAILSMAGVGGVKIYSGADWNGGGTVKCVIVDSDNGVPSDTLVESVQTAIDPEMNQGEGIGLAPIGHFVTIVGANEVVVNITTTLDLEDNVSWASVKANVESAIESYLNSLNAKWGEHNNNFNYFGTVIRITHINEAIINVQGVMDAFDTQINGRAENLSVDKDSIVTMGAVNE